jgi:hypothetical protein
MAIDIKPEMIKEIAEMLDVGMLCFYNKTTGELDFYPDKSQNPGSDMEAWDEVINKVDENYGDYIRFEPMYSSASFRMMEGFISNIDHIPTHNRFINAISRKRPFAHFKGLLLDYPELREQWFVYKQERYMEYVKEQAETEE